VLVALRAHAHGERFRMALLSFGLGVLAFVPAHAVQRIADAYVDLDPGPRGQAAIVPLLFALLVAAPLEQGLKVAAVAPAVRRHQLQDAIDGVAYACAAALGFVTVKNAVYLWGKALSPDLARAMLALPAHVMLAGAWGWGLSRDPARRWASRSFKLAWLGATAMNGVYDHLVFDRSRAAMLAALPVLLALAGVSVLAVRDLRGGMPLSSGRRSRLSLMAPPSLGAMRDAQIRTERPVMLTWIGFGTLVTTGVTTASLAGAVAVGHSLGLDFAAVDRDAASPAGVAPLVLLGAAALFAFPVAGYLIARASSTRTVLEPAMSAALAILAFLVVLGLASPVAVVFALAFAPVAFGLACAGAWVGLAR
jgi:RsiW-degrading membrane proteinase PrsW (M82 family)